MTVDLQADGGGLSRRRARGLPAGADLHHASQLHVGLSQQLPVGAVTYHGPMILVRAVHPSDACKGMFDRLNALLDALEAPFRPTLSSLVEPDRLLLRFRPRLSAAAAYQVVRRVAEPFRRLLDLLVWVGPPGTTTYGDTSDMSRDALARIASGAKTTAYASFADCLQDGEVVARVGGIVSVLDHRGEPALVYRVTQVDIMPFARLPQAFDPSIVGSGPIAAWQAEHRAYFEGIGAFDPDMPIICERFVLQRLMAGGAARRTV